MGKKQKKPGKGKEKTEKKTAKAEVKKARRETKKLSPEDDIDAILVLSLSCKNPLFIMYTVTFTNWVLCIIIYNLYCSIYGVQISKLGFWVV